MRKGANVSGDETITGAESKEGNQSALTGVARIELSGFQVEREVSLISQSIQIRVLAETVEEAGLRGGGGYGDGRDEASGIAPLSPVEGATAYGQCLVRFVAL